MKSISDTNLGIIINNEKRKQCRGAGKYHVSGGINPEKLHLEICRRYGGLMLLAGPVNWKAINISYSLQTTYSFLYTCYCTCTHVIALVHTFMVKICNLLIQFLLKESRDRFQQFNKCLFKQDTETEITVNRELIKRALTSNTMAITRFNI